MQEKIELSAVGEAGTSEWPNPLGLDGIRFLEICGSPSDSYEEILGKIGMLEVGRSDDELVTAYKQGDVLIIENHDSLKYAGRVHEIHGPCVSAVGLGVANAEVALAAAQAAGARTLDLAADEKLFDCPVLEGVGGVALYLIQIDREHRLYESTFGRDLTEVRPEGVGFYDVDHITHNVRVGQIDHWLKFYGDVFGFKPIFKVDEGNRLGKLTSMKTVAIMSPCGRFRIAINEPTEAKSQIQQFIDENNGEGVQHIALAAHDLYESLEQVSKTDFPFQSTPKAYYELLPERMENHGEDLERLERLGMLLDGEQTGSDDKPGWTILLQIFSKNVVGPAFFEFIQRKGNQGFGDNNAQALFASIEREQQKTGFLPGE